MNKLAKSYIAFFSLLINYPYADFQADVLEFKYKTATDDIDRVKVELQTVNKEKQSLEKKCSQV